MFRRCYELTQVLRSCYGAYASVTQVLRRYYGGVTQVTQVLRRCYAGVTEFNFFVTQVLTEVRNDA